MKLLDPTLWEKGLANNQDEYGSAIYRYAEAWANLMEERMVDGATVADVAKRASHDTDVEGITGYMYGAAAFILSHAWEYGEELRRWHNLETQIGDEGEKANENGGVLNPALMTINI